MLRTFLNLITTQSLLQHLTMRHRKSKVTSIVYIVAGLLSMILAIVVLTVPALFGDNDGFVRILFVGMLLLYGGWRVYTGLSQMKQNDHNPNI